MSGRQKASANLLLALAFFGWSAFKSASAFQATLQTPASIFEWELPELGLAPTTQPEIVIPSPNLNQVLIHILSPQAANIDYGQIYTYLNGEATARIARVVATARGKLVQLDLTRLSDFRLVPGRNTIEIRAINNRNRTFYASFVLRTATENRNQSFFYLVKQGQEPKQLVPPELVLLEPEHEIQLPPNRRTQNVRIAGYATAVNAVVRVTVNGQSVPIKRDAPTATRKLGLANEVNRVIFDTTVLASVDVSPIVVEAVDATGNSTQLQIPVRVRNEVPPPLFRGRKYALLVGISRFRHQSGYITNLRYADADARSLYEFLQSPSGGSFPTENMLLLVNEQATLARFREALASLITRAGPDDLLVIFLATHGGPDEQARQNLYFALHDTEYERLAETALAMKELQTYLQQNIRARRMVMLVDTCQSAGLTETPREIMRGGSNLANLYIERLLYGEEGRAVITASDVDEASREGERWGGGHGVFTYYVLSGLRGEADLNGDRLVTLGELFRFVRHKVRLDTQFSQNPRLLIGTNENLVLAAVSTPRR